jgi:dihydrofolate reductase
VIAAVAENGVIGRKGALPWRIPEDFRFYLGKVRDQIIILGRHCFYEADHPAALTIALSRNPQWQPSPLKVPSIYTFRTNHFYTLLHLV